jgi:erythrocyte band 7 integral membrane protein
MLRIWVLERYVGYSHDFFLHSILTSLQVVHGIYGSLIQGLGSVVGFFGAIPCCPCPNPFRNVHQGRPSPRVRIPISNPHDTCPGSVGLVTRFGQFYKSVDPGLVQVNVCTENLRIVDVKVQISPIGRQMVITRDNVNVEMYV